MRNAHLSIDTIYIGGDISKHHLDGYCSDTGRYTRYANMSTGIAAFLGMLDTVTSLVVMEATGGCEKPLQGALQQAGSGSPARGTCRFRAKSAGRFSRHHLFSLII